MPTVRANGIEIGYDIDAPDGADETAPTLILLHGATSIGADDWAAQRPILRRMFRCYLPDARGHGRTRWDPAAGWTHDLLVDDLEAFVDALGLERFHLAGFSMGAMTAITYAARHPERLRTLLVASITTQREPRASVARRLMDPARADADPAWKATLARRHDAGQGVDAWRRLLPAIAADVLVHPLLTPRDMRQIEVPTLLCVGDRDPFAPVDHVWGMKRQLPDAQLFVAPDCGHEITARRPALFNEAMAAFYRTANR
jgi:pimeloyl-ACP methyl ester carboxylesterase